MARTSAKSLQPKDLKALAAKPWSQREVEILGLRPVTDGGTLYCSCATTLPFAINGVRYQWPKDSVVRWHIGMLRLGELSDMDMKGARERTCAEIQSYVRRLKLEYSPNPKTANLFASPARLDGAQGILADHGVPMGNVGPNTQLQGRFDTSEAWTLSKVAVPGRIDWERTDKHELLHGLGFGHGKIDKANPALLEPTYSWSISMLQPRDIEELQLRYEAAEVAQPTPAPVPGEYKFSFGHGGVTCDVFVNPTAAGVSVRTVTTREGHEAVLAGSKGWTKKTA